jgi:hypothetical protein
LADMWNTINIVGKNIRRSNARLCKKKPKNKNYLENNKK